MFVCAFQISWISIMKTLYYETTSATFLQNVDAKFIWIRLKFASLDKFWDHHSDDKGNNNLWNVGQYMITRCNAELYRNI
jgi:hypothetical protein